MKNVLVFRGVLAVALLLAGGAQAQFTNNCPQIPAEVDFWAINATALVDGSELFSPDNDGESAEGQWGVVEVAADGIPDLMALALIEFSVREGSDFYNDPIASACATYQANYDATWVATEEIAGLLPGGPPILAALMTADKDWAPLTEAFVYEELFGTVLPMNPDDYTELPGLQADDDPDGDSLTNLQEWQALGAVYDDDSDTWSIPALGEAADTNEEVYAQYAVACLAGSDVIVTVVPSASEVFPGDTITLSASSNADPADTAFTFESLDTDIATVAPSGAIGAIVTGVAEGSVTIEATANNSGAKGSIVISVVNPEWFDLCDLDNAFDSQGALLAAALDLAGVGDMPADFGGWDIELGEGDAVLDQWQLKLLAYALCEGGVSKAVDIPAVVAQWESNLTEVGSFTTALNDMPDFLESLGPDIETGGTEILTMAATYAGGFPGNAVELGTLEGFAAAALVGMGVDPAEAAATAAALIDAANGGIEWVTTAAILEGTGVTMQDLAGEIGEYGELLGGVTDLLAGLWGLSSEMEGTLVALMMDLGMPDLVDLVDALNDPQQGPQAAIGIYWQLLAAALNEHVGGPGSSGTLIGAFPTLAPFAATLTPPEGALALAAGTLAVAPVPSAPFPFPPTIEIYGVSGKTVDEPFSGYGDYNEDGLFNAEVAAAVEGSGGNSYDFVCGATGDCGEFWPGNPGLPVSGALSIALLAGTLGLGGAVIRRKK